MATTRRSVCAPLDQTLLDQPHRFDFFQAVRLMERIADACHTDPSGKTSHAVGEDNALSQEAVRFRALPSHAFPVGPISQIRDIRPSTQEDPPRLCQERGTGTSHLSVVDEFHAPLLGASPPFLTKPNKPSKQKPREMIVGHFGLIGPSGVLPHHYTSLVIARVRGKDDSLRDFLDLFNHRAISLFYRAWEKYRFPVTYERFARSERNDSDRGNWLDQVERSDPFTHLLRCLIGQGTGGLANRMAFDDAALIYYAGYFAQQTPATISLESLLADYFETGVSIHQFCGQWLYLEEEDISRLPSSTSIKRSNNRLGESLVLGRRVWDVENRFRVCLGPMGYNMFCQFTPSGDALKPICQMIRRYVGSQYDFVIQPVLRAEEVPPCRLGGDTADPSRLGWNTWLRSRSLDADADEALFFLE